MLLHDFLGHLNASRSSVDLFYTTEMGSANALILQVGKCVYISKSISQSEFCRILGFTFIYIYWIYFPRFQNCLGLSLNKTLSWVCFKPCCSIFQVLCPNSFRNSGMKQVETKAVQSRSVTFGPFFISAVSVCFNEEGSLEVLWKQVCLGYVQPGTWLASLETSLENFCPLACMSRFTWKTMR